jgi:large subunit ribosomal protein L15
VRPAAPARSAKLVVSAAATAAAPERLRLHNLSPTPGSRRQEKRKGRGHAAGQGCTCGFGNRGQKSRSGSGVRPGFEGGQMPLYRRLPKLKGIAGGMEAGLPDFNVVNLSALEAAFEAGAEVTLAAVEAKGLLTISGRESKLPLKVLGTGALSKPLVIHAASFSASAMEKIAAAGGKAETVAGRKKWTRKAHKANVADMVAKGLDYGKEMAKKKAARVAAKKAAAA